MVRDHGNHNSCHLDRVVYVAIYGVPAFDNIDSTRNQRKDIELSFLVILYRFFQRRIQGGGGGGAEGAIAPPPPPPFP